MANETLPKWLRDGLERGDPDAEIAKKIYLPAEDDDDGCRWFCEDRDPESGEITIDDDRE